MSVMFFSNEINAVHISYIIINGFIICANILNKSNNITKRWKHVGNKADLYRLIIHSGLHVFFTSLKN